MGEGIFLPVQLVGPAGFSGSSLRWEGPPALCTFSLSGHHSAAGKSKVGGGLHEAQVCRRKSFQSCRWGVMGRRRRHPHGGQGLDWVFHLPFPFSPGPVI